MGAGIATKAGLDYKRNKDASKQERIANEQKTDLMQQAAMQYQGQRPVQNQARMNALRAQMGLLAPVNGALGKMYGADAKMNLNVQNPFSGVNGASGAGDAATSGGGSFDTTLGTTDAARMSPWEVWKGNNQDFERIAAGKSPQEREALATWFRNGGVPVRTDGNGRWVR
jgi:hypothetical protein